MRSSIIYGFYLLLLAAIVTVSASLTHVDEDREGRIRSAFHNYLENNSEGMLSALHELYATLQDDSVMDPLGIAKLKSGFLQLRLAYKRIEPFSCYYFLASERNFNGPVVPEIEDETEDRPQIEYPHGLQVMESYLWDENPSDFRAKLLSEIELMNENLSALRIAFRTLPTDEVRFIEAIQLQVIRMFTLGISQFDTPESKNAIAELRTGLQSLDEIIRNAYAEEIKNQFVGDVLLKLEGAKSYFNKINSPDEIDFLSIYQKIYLPLSKSLAGLRTGFIVKNYYPSSALRLDAPSVFETGSFNRFFFNPRGTDPEFSGEAAALGKALFFDPVLSENNKRACASCHQPEKAFVDGLATSHGFLEGEMLTRNAPTIINAALQRNYFFDMRADHLEGQIGHVLLNKKEMQSTFESAIKKLNSSGEYVEWFRRAFRGKEDTVISKNSIENAISEYERTLVSFNSKFDRNIRGEENSFTAEEKTGFNIFMNKGRCATCHYLPLFNNVVPPYYTRSEFEIIGTTKTADFHLPELDPDKGRGGLYGTEIFMHAFKTPTLRNIALTAPYMHNGSFVSLDQVMEFYNKGGGAGLGLDVPNQTLSSDSLQLTSGEIKSVISFLNTLTDTTKLTAKPLNLPLLSDPALNARKIGGEY